MTITPQIRLPRGLAAPAFDFSGPQADLRLSADLQALREIVAGLNRLEERLDCSPIPEAIKKRGYFTPDEDDRVRQGVLLYRNSRLATYEIILRYRGYASIQTQPCQLRCFLVAFGAALVLYAKSLKIIAVAEHVPMLRAKINEPDSKYDMEAGFFDDVVAGYSQLRNYRSMLQADLFWRAHRREANALVTEEGGDWRWLVELIRHQRYVVRNRLLHVLWQRLRHDVRGFCRSILSPFRRARHGLESVLGDRLAGDATTGPPCCAINPAVVKGLQSTLRPGDVLLVRNDSRLTTALLPGFWTHAALFLGGARDLENLGLRSHPRVARHLRELADDPAGMGFVIESQFPCVQLNPLDKCLQVDHLLVLRPTLPISEIASAIGEAMGHLGKPYDLDFDFNVSSRIVCTELIYRSYHNRGGLSFSLIKRLGRFTLTGDDIAAQVLDALSHARGDKLVPFQPIALLLKRRDGQPHAANADRILPLLSRIRRGWRPARQLRTRKPAATSVALSALEAVRDDQR